MEIVKLCVPQKTCYLIKLFVSDFLLIYSLVMETINKTTNYDLISISSYSRLYSGIVDFLKCKMYTRKVYIFFIQNPKRQHSLMNQLELE